MFIFYHTCVQETSKGQYEDSVQVDGANGVGALKMREMLNHLGSSIKIDVQNDGTTGKLNHLVCSVDQILSLETNHLSISIFALILMEHTNLSTIDEHLMLSRYS